MELALEGSLAHIHDLVGKYFRRGVYVGQCSSHAVGASPVDAYTDAGCGDSP